MVWVDGRDATPVGVSDEYSRHDIYYSPGAGKRLRRDTYHILATIWLMSTHLRSTGIGMDYLHSPIDCTWTQDLRRGFIVNPAPARTNHDVDYLTVSTFLGRRFVSKTGSGSDVRKARTSRPRSGRSSPSRRAKRENLERLAVKSTVWVRCPCRKKGAACLSGSGAEKPRSDSVQRE